jgi:hypothetical protein
MTKIFLLFVINVLLYYNIFAQKNTINSDQDQDTSIIVHAIYNSPVYVWAAPMPMFPGGQAKLKKHIAKHIKLPQFTKKNNIEGTVYVNFIVECDGSISNIRILRNVNPILDSEALNVVRTLPEYGLLC